MSLSTQDTLDILQLYSRYNTAIDTGDGKTFANCFVEGGKFDAGCATTGSPGDLTYAPNLWCVIVSMARRATWVLARRIMTDCTTTVAIVAAGKACTYFHAP